MARPLRLLILGGTSEAVGLAAAAGKASARPLTVITSLAGRTADPVVPPGELRIGGFGGSDGLAAYLREAAIDAVVDATHPFARQISEHAREACEAAGVPRLMLIRPGWTERPGDRWHRVANAEEAARVTRELGRRAFLTIGARNLEAFSSLRDVWFLVRLVDPPREPLPLATHEVLVARGPFERDAEAELLKRHRIDVLVTKASGGRLTEGKIAAARLLALPVVLLRRPQAVAGAAVDSVDAALAWVEHQSAALDSRAIRDP